MSLTLPQSGRAVVTASRGSRPRLCFQSRQGKAASEVVAHRPLGSATVVTMLPVIGDLPHSHMLIEVDRFAAIAPTLTADDIEVIDPSQYIVVPRQPPARVALRSQRALDNAASRVVSGQRASTSPLLGLRGICQG